MLNIKQCLDGIFVYNKNHLYTGSVVHEHGEYSPEEVSIIGLIVRPGDVVVEVGSNIGLITIPMCKMVGSEGMVYCIEAQPRTYELLVANICINSVSRSARHCNMAVVGNSHVGPVLIDSYDDCDVRNVGGITTGHGPIEVDTMVLDDLYSDVSGISLIKIDAEGNELDILNGGTKIINQYKPVIYCEDNEYCVTPDQNNPSGRKSNSAELREFIGSLGYQIFKHQPQLTRQLDIVSHNLLCFHKDDKRRDEFFSKVQQ